MKHALVVTGDPEARAMLGAGLAGEFEVDGVDVKADSLEALRARPYDFLFIDVLHLIAKADPETGFRQLLQPYWRTTPSVEIVVLCGHQHIRKAVDAVKAGASNYLTYPLDKKEVRYIVETTVEATRAQLELDYFRDQFWDKDSLRIVKTRNGAMQKVFERVRSVAPTESTVLITGETGTGKGVIAKLIHAHSPRKSMQFMSVHCGAIPENLIESELFGHEKGSFTGATKRKLGKFEIARGGTLFLDEIATMPSSAQVKLLQVLQDRIFSRVGGEDSIAANVRVIAATNADLAKLVASGDFRQDLFYRLDVFPVLLPPLRDRPEDIPQLAEEFLFGLNKAHTKHIQNIHPEVLEAFRQYTWPGNIRELENLMERAYILETTSTLTPESFPHELFRLSETHADIPLNTSLTLSEVRRRTFEDIERNYLKELLGMHEGRIDSTAEAAGISTRQLHKLLTRHGIRKEEFKKATIHSFRHR